MPHRKVTGLQSAQLLLTPPNFNPTRLRGTKALGKTFENQIAKALPHAKRGVWFSYVDANGYGICQPDFLVKWQDSIVILESKLTRYQDAVAQLRELYIPVVGRVFNCTPLGVVVLKHVSAVPPEAVVVDTMAHAVAIARSGTLPVLHFLGRGSL